MFLKIDSFLANFFLKQKTVFIFAKWKQGILLRYTIKRHLTMQLILPTIVQLEITENCNFRCQHCYRLENAERHFSHQPLTLKTSRLGSPETENSWPGD